MAAVNEPAEHTDSYPSATISESSTLAGAETGVPSSACVDPASAAHYSTFSLVGICSDAFKISRLFLWTASRDLDLAAFIAIWIEAAADPAARAASLPSSVDEPCCIKP